MVTTEISLLQVGEEIHTIEIVHVGILHEQVHHWSSAIPESLLPLGFAIKVSL